MINLGHVGHPTKIVITTYKNYCNYIAKFSMVTVIYNVIVVNFIMVTVIFVIYLIFAGGQRGPALLRHHTIFLTRIISFLVHKISEKRLIMIIILTLNINMINDLFITFYHRYVVLNI